MEDVASKRAMPRARAFEGTDDDLSIQIGPRGSSVLLNLDTISVACISGGKVSDGSTMNQISAYGAYAQYSTGGTRQLLRSTASNMVVGADATLARNALHDLHFLERGSVFTASQRAALRTLSTDASRAARLYAGNRLSLAEACHLLRPYFVGTCPDLNGAIGRLPNGLRQVAMYVFNDLLRSFGNVFWCCNPWSGLCFLLAIAVSSPFQAVVALVACVVGGLTGEALGAGRGMMALGLLQFNGIIVAQNIAYSHRRSPPFEDAWVEVAPSLGVIGLVIASSAFATLLSLVINPLIIRHFGIIPVSMPVLLATVIMTGVGFSSNQYLSLQNEWAIPLSIYGGAEKRNGTEWDFEWDRVTAAWFHGITSTVWAEGTASALLCWLGLTLCSPLLALLALGGLIVGSCTLVLVDAPAWMLYDAYFHWEFMQCSYLIGGLIFNVSWNSVFFGLLCSCFSACLGLAARVWLAPLALPTGPVVFGASAILFSCIRFHKTFMTPVELAEMTVPEDHLYQRLMAKKVMADVATSFRPHRGADDELLLVKGAHHALTDAFLTCISFGAYSLHTFEPTAVGQRQFGGMSHERRAQVDPPDAMIGLLLDLYAKLNRNEETPWTSVMGVDAAHDRSFMEAVLALTMLTGLRTATKKDLATFKARWAFIRDERFAVHLTTDSATREAFFVFFMLTGLRDRELSNQMQTFLKFADKDDSGSLSLSEFQVQATLAYPGEAWINEVIEELFAQDDDGFLDADELARIAFKRSPERWIAVLKALPKRIAAVKSTLWASGRLIGLARDVSVKAVGGVKLVGAASLSAVEDVSSSSKAVGGVKFVSAASLSAVESVKRVGSTSSSTLINAA